MTITNLIPRTVSPQWYVSQELFEFEKKYIFPHQLFFAGHCSQFSQAGEYVRLSVLGNDLIVCRQENNNLKAMANRCLHRGATLMQKDTGRIKKITCPYHAWSYDIDGKLISTRKQLAHMEKNHCLHQYQILEQQGLALLSLQTKEQDANLAIEKLSPYWEFYGLKHTKVVQKKRYNCQANWKVVSENFLECFHCAPCHPQLSIAEGHIELFESGNINEFLSKQRDYFCRAEKLGHLLPTSQFIQPEQDVYAVINGVHLSPPRATGTQDGQLLSKLLGKQVDIDHGFLYGSLGPFIHFTIYSDHIVLFSFIPKATDQTDVEVLWLTNEDLDSEQLEKLTWLWHHTIEQDCRLCEMVQEQTSSVYAEPGYFTEMEADSALFNSWYQRKYQNIKKNIVV